MSELRACPFCGSKYISNKNNGMGQNLTGCDKCGARVYYKFQTLEDAAKAWNTRPLEDALIAERDLLRQQMEVAKEALDEIYGSWRDSDRGSDYAVDARDTAEIALTEIAKLGEKK